LTSIPYLHYFQVVGYQQVSFLPQLLRVVAAGLETLAIAAMDSPTLSLIDFNFSLFGSMVNQ